MPKFESTNITHLVRRTTNGTYYARVVHHGTDTLRSLGTASFKEAKRLLPAIVQKIRGAPPPGGEGSVELVSALHGLFDAARRDYLRGARRAGTVRYLEKLVKRILAAAAGVGTLRVDHVRPADVGRILATFEAPDQWRKARALLAKAGCAEACKGMLPPVRPPREVRLPSPEELDAMIDAMPDPGCRFLARLLASCGLRIGEAYQTTWEDFDAATGALRIKATKVPAVSRSGGTRTIPLIPAALELLSAVPPDRRAGPLAPVPQAVFRRAWNKATGGKLWPHDLRRFFITRALECGVPVHVVAIWAGHSAAILLQTYAKARDSFSTEQAARVTWRKSAACGDDGE